MMNGGKGMPGMPFMPPMGMMPPMGFPPMGMGYPGMMPGMAPGMMGAAVGGQKGKDQGGSKEKTRERRRRKNKSGKPADEVAEEDDENVVRSDELNEVRRAGQGKCTKPLGEVIKQAIEFAKDQHGSRFLQTKLEDPTTDAADKNALFEAIAPQVKELSRDQFGNFVIQKLFDTVTADQKRTIAEQL